MVAQFDQRRAARVDRANQDFRRPRGDDSQRDADAAVMTEVARDFGELSQSRFARARKIEPRRHEGHEEKN